MARLIIILEVEADPARTDPQDIADYAIDPDCDDPVLKIVSAEWEEEM